MSDHVFFFFWKVHMPHLHSSADGSMLPFLFFLLCIFNISINVINNLEKASENLEMQHSKCEMQYSNCWNGIDKLLDFKNYFKNIHIRYHCVALTPKKQLGANDFEIDAWFKKKNHLSNEFRLDSTDFLHANKDTCPPTKGLLLYGSAPGCS